jgi:hypothetical protein
VTPLDSLLLSEDEAQVSQGIELARVLPWEEIGPLARWMVLRDGWLPWGLRETRCTPVLPDLLAEDWPPPKALTTQRFEALEEGLSDDERMWRLLTAEPREPILRPLGRRRLRIDHGAPIAHPVMVLEVGPVGAPRGWRVERVRRWDRPWLRHAPGLEVMP